MQEPYITTYPSGTQVTFMNPRPEQFHLDDIAHSLSLCTRFVGHISRLYSVAEHCCHVSDEVFRVTGSHQAAMCALLHDAEEAYLVDLPGPLKEQDALAAYRGIAFVLKRSLFERFSIDSVYPEWRDAIYEADRAMLHTEGLALSHNADWQDSKKVLKVQLDRCSEQEVVNILWEASQEDNSGNKDLLIASAIEHLVAGGAQNRWRKEFLKRYEHWSY